MTPLQATIIMGIVLVLAGLAFCWGHEKVRWHLLARAVYCTGVALAVLGLLIVLFPVFAWLHKTLMDMFGIAHGV